MYPRLSERSRACLAEFMRLSGGLRRNCPRFSAVPTHACKTEPVSEKQMEDSVEKIPDLTGFVREQMEKRYEGTIAVLYEGQLCSSCGVRFTSSAREKYRDHLDWHYRQNRAKKAIRRHTAHRGWYCHLEDWIRRDDSGSVEDRAQKSLVSEQAHSEKMQGAQEQRKSDLPMARAALNLVNESCEICREPFDLMWEDEPEQWSLINSVRFDGKAYHPSCYEDCKNALGSADCPSIPSLKSGGEKNCTG